MAEIINLFIARQEAKRAADDKIIGLALRGYGATAGDVVMEFYTAIETLGYDDEERFLYLLQLFEDADEQGRAMINNIVQTICGWTLADLVRLAAGKRVDGERWAPAGEED